MNRGLPGGERQRYIDTRDQQQCASSVAWENMAPCEMLCGWLQQDLGKRGAWSVRDEAANVGWRQLIKGVEL